MNHILLGLSFGDFLRVRVRSGLLEISTLFGEKSCGSMQTAPALLLLPLVSAWMYRIAQPIMMDE
jgi:hypothetical protein